ncbi:MAG: four helix bundle protein [Flammeovirgaceae bacterium]|nr:four helix bundle protein [Flammeovirgaceae bacterium]
MAKIERFEDLDVWKKARELAYETFLKTEENPFAKDFSLKDQINRSTGSVMDNIAEGFEREGRQEFIQFLSYAKASAAEVRSQLYRAKDRNYLSQEEFESLITKAESIGKNVRRFYELPKTI